MADPYSNINNLGDQGRKIVAITPNDGANLTDVYKALWIDSPGTLKFDAADGGTGITLNVPAGPFDLVRVKKIYSTGTSASGIYGVN